MENRTYLNWDIVLNEETNEACYQHVFKLFDGVQIEDIDLSMDNDTLFLTAKKKSSYSKKTNDGTTKVRYRTVQTINESISLPYDFDVQTVVATIVENNLVVSAKIRSHENIV